jgi:hypothetical protein
MNNILKSFEFKDTLSPDIWDNVDTNDFTEIKLKSDVRAHILKIADAFIDSVNVEPFDVKDIFLVGSICNYNWSNYSDVDIHLAIDKSKLGDNMALVDEFLDSKKKEFTENHDIKIKGFDIEMYVQDVDREDLKSKGVYNVLFNKWVTEPDKSGENLDKEAIIKKVKSFYKDFESIQKLSNNTEKIHSIDVLKDKIKKYRQSGLDKNGEFGTENMVFKYLRRVGFIEKLIDLKYDLIDRKLSLENVQ